MISRRHEKLNRTLKRCASRYRLCCLQLFEWACQFCYGKHFSTLLATPFSANSAWGTCLIYFCYDLRVYLLKRQFSLKVGDFYSNPLSAVEKLKNLYQHHSDPMQITICLNTRQLYTSMDIWLNKLTFKRKRVDVFLLNMRGVFKSKISEVSKVSMFSP